MPKKIAIVGGHGEVSLRLARILGPSHSVTSIIRNPAHEADIKAASAIPLLLSLEEATVADFTAAFQGVDVVYFSAGAGEAGPERTKAVDWDGAVKVFDAIEAVKGTPPRLILVSAIDIRDPNKIPAHYTKQDIEFSKQARAAMSFYIHCKYEADKNLAKRTAFKWTILRPGYLDNKPGTGKASIGRTHFMPTISRDDVATALALLLERDDAAGLGIDMVGGDTPIAAGLDAFIEKGETDFLG
ncbi:NADH(P)-binding-domain-containing protein [Mycena haematopus]|nr:NADH(P)-binding-domain-containing protein [Mycena haematopus]